jgi:DNA polymerase-3 subunit delta'
MISLKNILGQRNAVRFLSGNIASGRIANGYLFSGPDGVGKALAAKAFLASLICSNGQGKEACGVCPVCAKVSSGTHPDVLWIKPEKNKKIIVDDIRRIKEQLCLKPYEAPRAAAVIEDAHMMNAFSSNALLKVLEEPPGSSLIILLTNKRELLLPTVVSRCMEVRFGPLPQEDTVRILASGSMDGERARFFAYLSGGSPGKAAEMAGGTWLQRREEIAERIARIERREVIHWDTEEKDKLIEDAELSIMMLRDAAFGKGVFSGYSVDRLYEIISRIADLKKSLEGNANPKIVSRVFPVELGCDPGRG